MKFTEKDKIIFENLFYDARISTHKLAKIVKMKQPSVHARIKKLEKEGFISRYDCLINPDTLPLIYKMYYTSLSKEHIQKIIKMPICFGLQEIFGEYTHQIFCFFKNKKQIKTFEKQLPKKIIIQLLTHSHKLGGTIFDTEIQPEKQPIKKNKKIILDKTDIKLLHKMILGGARKTIVELAAELNKTCAVIKYRKKRLINNNYFLYFVAQPGEAFKSIKISYHVFSLDENINIKKITLLPRCIIAYSGEKTLTVIQLSFSFNDYLKHSNILFRKLEPNTKNLQTFFINKPIILNRLSEKLLIN